MHALPQEALPKTHRLTYTPFAYALDTGLGD